MFVTRSNGAARSKSGGVWDRLARRLSKGQGHGAACCQRVHRCSRRQACDGGSVSCARQCQAGDLVMVVVVVVVVVSSYSCCCFCCYCCYGATDSDRVAPLAQHTRTHTQTCRTRWNCHQLNLVGPITHTHTHTYTRMHVRTGGSHVRGVRRRRRARHGRRGSARYRLDAEAVPSRLARSLVLV